MSYDIYGDDLRSGHCEVHPWVHESYPCPVCIRENEERAAQRRSEAEYYSRMEAEHYEQMVREEAIGIDGEGI